MVVVVDDLSLFFHSVLELKSIKRAGWVSKVQVEDAESVADHTFSMATLAMLLSDMLGFDTHKVIKMVLMHDLAESMVGDYVPGDVTARQKLAKEKKAMKFILSGLPKEVREEYEEIWLEYLHNETEIARFVHRMDKLEMALQADQYARQGYEDNLLAPFFESAKTALGDADDIVSEILKSLRPASAKK
ncbi:MAG: HD domain-containing protein [Thermoproteota archaeon]|nr:HD domain-containing protein [Thermoproteota archaeon]